jgi:hypothetical protein
MEEQMNMSVDESRKKRLIAQIDELGVSGMLHRRSGFDDPFSLNKNFARRQELAAFDFEQSRRMQDNGMRGRSLGARGNPGEKRKPGAKENKPAEFHGRRC